MKYGLYAAVFFAAVGISAYLTIFFLIKGQPEVQVPDLTGKGAVTALKTLSDQGLNLKVEATDHSDTIPKDHIISQDPPAGTMLKKKREVRVVLSLGSATVAMPDLRGLPLPQAASILEQSRLQTGLLSQTYGSGPEQGRDRILAQSPEPMTKVKVGTKVNLLLSLGPRPKFLVMPDLTGQPYSLALIALERSGLTLGRLETEMRDNWPEETVVLQDPPAGSRTASGSLVRLTVNRAEGSELEEYRFQVLEHHLPYGFFPKEIRFRIAMGPYFVEQYQAWHGPGERVRFTALVQGRPRVHLYLDGAEIPFSLDQEQLIGVFDDQDSPFRPFGRLYPSGG